MSTQVLTGNPVTAANRSVVKHTCGMCEGDSHKWFKDFYEVPLKERMFNLAKKHTIILLKPLRLSLAFFKRLHTPHFSVLFFFTMFMTSTHHMITLYALICQIASNIPQLHSVL